MAKLNVVEEKIVTKTITLELTEKEAWFISVLLGNVGYAGPFEEIANDLYQAFADAGFDALDIDAGTENTINLTGTGQVR